MEWSAAYYTEPTNFIGNTHYVLDLDDNPDNALERHHDDGHGAVLSCGPSSIPRKRVNMEKCSLVARPRYLDNM